MWVRSRPPWNRDWFLIGTHTIDQNFMTPPATPTPGLSVSGAFTPFASGVFTGTITGLDIDTQNAMHNFTYYIVDTTKSCHRNRREPVDDRRASSCNSSLLPEIHRVSLKFPLVPDPSENQNQELRFG